MRLNRIKNDDIEEKVLVLNRVSQTAKGGRMMSFSALVAVGDKKGMVGIGLGKAKSVMDAVKKGAAQARRGMKKYSLTRLTLPHEAMGEFSATKVFMKPAPPGTGVVAGSSAREILELIGVSDIYTKIIGSKNKLNVARATLDGLSQQRTYKEIAALRDKKL